MGKRFIGEIEEMLHGERVGVAFIRGWGIPSFVVAESQVDGEGLFSRLGKTHWRVALGVGSCTMAEMDRSQEEKCGWFPYGEGCVALFAALLLLMLAAYLWDLAEVMGSFMFALLVLWQDVRGLVIKRWFWRLPDEKVAFWSLLVALALGGGFFWLCLRGSAG